MRSVQICFRDLGNDFERMLLCGGLSQHSVMKSGRSGVMWLAAAHDLGAWTISYAYTCWLLFWEQWSPLEVVACWTVLGHCVRALEVVSSRHRNWCHYAVARGVAVMAHFSSVMMMYFKRRQLKRMRIRRCDACGAEKVRKDFKACACRRSLYCGPACQKLHWKKVHRHHCRARPWDRIRQERPLSLLEAAILLLLIAGGIFFYTIAPHDPGPGGMELSDRRSVRRSEL